MDGVEGDGGFTGFFSFSYSYSYSFSPDPFFIIFVTFLNPAYLPCPASSSFCPHFSASIRLFAFPDFRSALHPLLPSPHQLTPNQPTYAFLRIRPFLSHPSCYTLI